MSSPAVRLYAWFKNTKPVYYHDGCKLNFRYAEIIHTTVRSSSTKVMLEFETSVPFSPPKSFAIHLVNEWSDKTGICISLFYAYSNNKNRYTLVVTPRNAPKSSRHHRSKGVKVPKSEERIKFVSASTSQAPLETQKSDEFVAEASCNEEENTSNSDSESVVESGVFSEIEAEVHPQADEGFKTVRYFNGKRYDVDKLVTSKAINTDLSCELRSPPTLIERIEEKSERPTYAKVVGKNINLNYNDSGLREKIEMSYLSRNDVFERVRLQLAFFRQERNVNVNLMSYVSNKIYLINSGVAANDDKHLENLYFRFCEAKGLNTEEIQNDLKNTEYAIRTKRLNYLNAAKKNFFEFYGTDYSRSKVTIMKPHAIPSGRCDPECCILM